MYPVRYSVLLSSRICLLSLLGLSGILTAQKVDRHPLRTGVTTPGVQRPIANIHPDAIFDVQGKPDWMAVTPNAVWVTSSSVNLVTQLDAKTNKTGITVAIDKPCSGLVYGFGSLWVPSCGAHNLVRVDTVSGKIIATIPAAPADSEGGVTAGAGSVWLVTSPKGLLARIDPKSNTVIASIEIPSGSFAPAFGDGAVWITSTEHSLITRVNPRSNRVTATIPIGPHPRFLTVGAGSVWTLNQGDGTISRVDMKKHRLITNIVAGIPGNGGEIAYGAGSVWATVFRFPISRIDPATNQVVQQWTGPGGDSIRVGLGSVWLSDLMHGKVSRLNPVQP